MSTLTTSKEKLRIVWMQLTSEIFDDEFFSA